MRRALLGHRDMRPAGVAGSVQEFRSMVRDLACDVYLMDYQLTDGTALDCATFLSDEGMRGRLIMLTMHASPHVTSQSLDNGFEKVLSKDETLEHVLEAIRVPAAHRNLNVGSVLRFSRRQREVLELMGQGLDPASIAAELFISVHTARSHVKDVLRTIGASTQLSAVTKAIREGYLLPPSKQLASY